MSKKDELINEMVELAEAQCIGGFNDIAYNRDLDYLLADYDIVPKNGGSENTSHESSELNKPDVSVSLLERAYGLVGHPCTNISAGTDLACEQWRSDYERWRNER